MPKNRSNETRPPEKNFSHPINVEEIPEQGLDLAISADGNERGALAERNGLVAIKSLEANFHVARQGLTQFNVSGTVRAKITQICVVSLEPFDSDMVEEVDVDFASQDAAVKAAARMGEVLVAPGALDRDPPDSIIDGIIDLGALVSEFLALGLDPYPKKPGVEFAPIEADEGGGAEKPFNVLRKLTDPS
jgi:hypothetical protein